MRPREQASAIGANHDLHSADDVWPAAAWSEYVRRGITGWTVPAAFGGAEASSPEILDGCMELARRDLLPVFVLTQFQAACQRIAGSVQSAPRDRWLARLAGGEVFGTVGISHLTTSRQHTGRPAVLAERVAGGYRLTGEIPWVTGAGRSQVLVIGGGLESGEQFLCAVPSDRDGLRIETPLHLVALTGSETGPISLANTFVADDELLSPVIPRILQQGQPGGAGSLMTSGLAAGHAQGCVDAIEAESRQRPNLAEIVGSFRRELDELQETLLRVADGRGTPDETAETLRTRATTLALQASQALLTASKGAGFVSGHPAERRAREALFFLVWSCPQAVSQRLMRDFSQCDAPL
ncbi:acyl-CoA dehydrogenase family protein [Planctomyces sp. SH-PL14]|uniref:acyl-CoA dehydrogenase family protein n=1 Tax=Planctomyces sp. SH-PL14 TaxID=1632864 RepID=UPI00078D6807|nr:acyl-CoA dehydrogenase family protein [Planctomyces sp. SH-PL14]AMV18138.1 hypothetical protein VT03_09630 [Planctomyces sp. SH-PL14]